MKDPKKIPANTIGILMDNVNDQVFMVKNGRIDSIVTGNYPRVSQEVLEREMERSCREMYLTFHQRLREIFVKEEKL